MRKLKIGSRIKYKNHEGEVFDIQYRDYYQVVGVRFDRRWRWDMSESMEFYFHYNAIKKIIVRVFTTEDPYGEEDWDY